MDVRLTIIVVHTQAYCFGTDLMLITAIWCFSDQWYNNRILPAHIEHHTIILGVQEFGCKGGGFNIEAICPS